MHNLYSTLTQYGAHTELDLRIESSADFIDWTEKNFNYVPYNPRTKIDREGLSITSLHGDIDGVPDLDSLHQYNIENGTNYEEKDFRTLTEVYHLSLIHI